MKFTLFKFPVRIDYTFFLVLLFLLQRELDARHFEVFALKAGVIFISILFHELGHAFTLRKFGVESELLLHSFGGLCISSSSRNLKHWQDLLVSLAGPTANFLLAAVCFIPILIKSEMPPLAFETLGFVVFVNLFWGLFNLVPLLPMDGAKALRSTLQHFNIAKAIDISFLISGGFLIAFAYWAFKSNQAWNLLLVGIFGWENYQMWAKHKITKELQRVRILHSEWSQTQSPKTLEKMLSIAEKNKDSKVKYDALLGSSILFSFMGNWQRALALFKKSNANSPLMLFLLGKADNSEDLSKLAEASLSEVKNSFDKIYLIRLLLYNNGADTAVNFLKHHFSDLSEHSELWDYISSDLHYMKQYQHSIDVGKELFEHDGRGIAAYNIACSLNRLKNKHEAMKYLQKAWTAGYQNKEAYLKDEDLESLKELKEFKALLIKV